MSFLTLRKARTAATASNIGNRNRIQNSGVPKNECPVFCNDGSLVFMYSMSLFSSLTLFLAVAPPFDEVPSPLATSMSKLPVVLVTNVLLCGLKYTSLAAGMVYLPSLRGISIHSKVLLPETPAEVRLTLEFTFGS